MNETDLKTSWYHFCSLATQFKETERYVDHRLSDNGQIANAYTFSDAFAQLLMLASSEFEVIAKAICAQSNIKLPERASIIAISKKLLTNYPLISETEVSTPYQTVCPLKSWNVIKLPDKKGRLKDTVIGIDWWDAHNLIKHDRNINYMQGNLENCFLSLSSLAVLLLYLVQKVTGNLNLISNAPCDYFDFKYTLSDLVVRSEHNLPDFQPKE